MNSRSLTLIAAAVFALAAPAAARADLYVREGAGATQCTQDDPCSLDQAVTIADIVSNRDTIRILGEYDSTTWVDLTHSPIDLIGSGRGAGGTRFEGDDAQIEIGPDSSASDLAVYTDGWAVQLASGGAVRDADLNSSSCGICLDVVNDKATTIDDVDVTGLQEGALRVRGGYSGHDLTVTGSHLSSWVTAVDADAKGTLRLQRSIVESDADAIVLSHVNSATIANSLVKAGGDGIVTSGGTSAKVDGSTVVATAAGAARGVAAEPQSSSAALVRGSIVRGFTADLSSGDNGIVQASRSDYGTSAGFFDLGGNTTVDPGWVDPANGDYRLAPTSPVVDKGTSDQPAAGETDLDGKPRLFDGDGDGTAVRDLGAYESQTVPAPPAPPAPPTPPATGGEQPAPQPPAQGQQPPEQGQQHPTVHTPMAMTPAPGPAALKLSLAGGKLKLDRRGRGTVNVACSAAPCSVKLTIRAGKRTLATATGKAGKIKVRLPLAYVKKHHVTRVKVTATANSAVITRTFRVL
jgi:hypothetical protein